MTYVYVLIGEYLGIEKDGMNDSIQRLVMLKKDSWEKAEHDENTVFKVFDYAGKL